MKRLLVRSAKLFIGFLFFSFGVLQIWDMGKLSRRASDNELLILAAILSIGLTILWMDYKRD